MGLGSDTRGSLDVVSISQVPDYHVNLVDRYSCVPEGRRHASMHMVCSVRCTSSRYISDHGPRVRQATNTRHSVRLCAVCQTGTSRSTSDLWLSLFVLRSTYQSKMLPLLLGRTCSQESMPCHVISSQETSESRLRG